MARLFFLWSAATCRRFVFCPTVECSIKKSADKSAHSKESKRFPLPPSEFSLRLPPNDPTMSRKRCG